VQLPFEPIPPLSVAPAGGEPAGISQRSLASETRVPGLSYGTVWVILGLAILVQHRLVTDRHSNTKDIR